jgi:NAD(P)-dependent dehydrogenase (short-subunit alcohol dehydrogenase family)
MPKLHKCPAELFELDLSGKVYVVTGGNSGIGKITVQQLYKQGATVVLACRRVQEGQKVKDDILMNDGAKGAIEVEELDLASLKSVRGFAEKILKSHPAIHGLINNAGIMNTPFGKTVDGFEQQIGVNHLGHYLLTELLLPALKAAAPSRIVCVASCFHDKAFGKEGVIDFEDMFFEKRKYDGWTAYAQSKLANVLHARQLAKRLEGTGVIAVSIHPGWVRTNLFKHSMPLFIQNYVLRPILKMMGMIEPWQGTQSSLYAVLSPDVAKHPGAFFSQVGMYRSKKANKGGWPMTSPNPHALDDQAAERLDKVSRQLVGL